MKRAICISIDRVYCKYHYLEYKSFSSSEEELLHFLKLLNNPNWEWLEQYGADEMQVEDDEENRMFETKNKQKQKKARERCFVWSVV